MNHVFPRQRRFSPPERQRATFAWKSGDLDAAGLRATLGPSTMTLGGLLKHMALVEDDTFSGAAGHGQYLKRGLSQYLI